MNSVHERCPNSDLNSAQNSALHQVRSCALCAHSVSSRAHTARAVPMSWVLLRAQQTGRARMRLCRARSCACYACPRRDPMPRSRHPMTTRQPESCRDIKSVLRHHLGHSRSRPQNGVATPFLLPSPKAGRDTETRSRPLLETNLCRDINFMSQPCFCPQWDFQVATPNSRSRPPTLLPMSRPQNDVATSSPA